MERKEFTRFGTLWDREEWHPDTAKLIDAWGDAIAVVLLEILNREIGSRSREERVARIEVAVSELERLRAETTPSVVRTRDGGQGDWRWFLHALYSSSGAGIISPVEQLALLVQESFERTDVAERLIAIDAFLEPENAGAGGAHLAAMSGRRAEGINALVAIVEDDQRAASARVHAVFCLKAVKAPEANAAAARLLDARSTMSEADAQIVSYELSEFIRRRARYGARFG